MSFFFFFSEKSIFFSFASFFSRKKRKEKMPKKKEAPAAAVAEKRVDFLDDDDDDDEKHNDLSLGKAPILRVNEGFAKRLEVRERGREREGIEAASSCFLFFALFLPKKFLCLFFFVSKRERASRYMSLSVCSVILIRRERERGKASVFPFLC